MSLRILRTAVGSPVAPFLLKQLKNNGYFLIGADIDALSCGFSFVDKSVLVPRADDPSYVDAIMEVCKQEHVDIFWPDLDEELLLIAENTARFQAIGVKVLISDKKTIATCSDKWMTYLALDKLGIPVPKSWDLDQVNDINLFPLILKPKKGRGSQGIIRITNKQELQKRVKPGYIAQELLTGKEYTIDVLNDFHGNYIYSSIRERVATDSGISIKGRTVENPVLTKYVSEASESLQLKGPSCFQCFINESGKTGFIEINPRIAGTVALSVLAGAPFITDSIQLLIENKVTPPEDYKAGLQMTRYWEQNIIDI